jgi:hypothetical protein
MLVAAAIFSPLSPEADLIAPHRFALQQAAAPLE